MSKKSKRQETTQPVTKPSGPEPRGLRERVKGSWITATEALRELKSKDPNPQKSIVNWLIRKGATS